HVDLLRNVGRKHIVDGCAVAVLLDVHCSHFEKRGVGVASHHFAWGLQAEEVFAPLPTDELQACEAQGRLLLPAVHVHAHEADAPEILHAVHHLFRLAHGDLELVPVHLLWAFGGVGGGQDTVSDEVATHHHVLGTHAHLVVEIA